MNIQTVTLWSLQSRTSLRVLTDLAVNALCLIGEMLVVGLDNGPIFVFNLNSGDKIFALEGHKMAVNSLNCAESGADGASILFSGCTDSTTRVWNLSSGECLGELRGTHSASVNCTTLFSSRLYTGSTDGRCGWSVRFSD